MQQAQQRQRTAWSGVWVGGLLSLLVSCGPVEGDAVEERSASGRLIVQVRPQGMVGVSGLMRQYDAETYARGGDATWLRALAAPKRALRERLPRMKAVAELERLPLMVVEVDAEGEVDELKSSEHVEAVWPDLSYESQDVESFAYVGVPAALATGLSGHGATVAVVDTGLDYRRSDFGACSAPGGDGCRVAHVQDFAMEDGQLDAHGHGTNVAGIVAGVAPGARLVGLDVFSAMGGAYASDIIAAVNWIITNKGEHNIVAANFSLGGGASNGLCPDDVFAAPLGALRAAGVLPVVASGNGASRSALASPACVPEAISVGAVYDASIGAPRYSSCADKKTAAGQPTCFSNSSGFLSLWAPGAQIAAGGYTMSGTSQAAPHVAGAVALLAERFPSDSTEQRASRLLSGAPAVTDPRNKVVRPRLSLASALGGCVVAVTPATVTLDATGAGASLAVTAPPGCSWSVVGSPSWVKLSASKGSGPASITLGAASNTGGERAASFPFAGTMLRVVQGVDTAPPTGTLKAPSHVSSPVVKLTLAASDPTGVAAMCLSATESCSAFVKYATSASVTVPAGEGKKSLFVWLRDGRGNTSASPLTATTTLDSVQPSDGVVTATRAGTKAALAWSGFDDQGSGVVRYLVTQSTSSTPPPAACAGKTVYAGTGAAAAIAVPARATRVFRVCAVDAAGNASPGSVTSFKMP